MRNIFELTKREQRIVILIVVALVVFAFVKHWFEIKSNPPRNSTSLPTASPTVHHEEEREDDDSR